MRMEMQKRETEIGEIPRRHRGHRQCACNFELTPQDIQPSRENFRPRLVTPARRALSLIIDRNVRCTAGQRACQQFHTIEDMQRCENCQQQDTFFAAFVALSRPTTRLCLRVFGSSALCSSSISSFLCTWSIALCLHVTPIRYASSAGESWRSTIFVQLSMFLSLSLSLPLSVSTPRSVICTLNPYW